MKFKILEAAVRRAESVVAQKRKEQVNVLIEHLTKLWGGDAKARSLAWNVAMWRLRRGLSLEVRKVLP